MNIIERLVQFFNQADKSKNAATKRKLSSVQTFDGNPSWSTGGLPDAGIPSSFSKPHDSFMGGAANMNLLGDFTRL